MSTKHHWWDCYPVLQFTEAVATPQIEQLGKDNLRRAWVQLSDTHRIHFHRATCEQDRSPATLLAIAEIKDILRREGLDTE
jgi:hypothetical protein